MVGGCSGYEVGGVKEKKTKPSSWGFAELGIKISRGGALADAM